MAEGFVFEASFDGIRMDVLSTSVQHGRAVIPHMFPKRDGAATEDMGREQFIASVQFIFIDNNFIPEGEGNFADRFRDFDNSVDEGKARIFVHPYVGAVRCNVSNFTHDADGDGQPVIRCNATFVEDITLEPVFVAGAGAQTRASFQEVNAESQLLTPRFEEIGFVSLVIDRVLDAVGRWESDPTLSAREVQSQMGVLIRDLNDELNTLNVAGDLSLYDILKGYTLLQHAVRRAAESFTATTSRIVTIRVTEPLPLRIIAARFYGADEAERRFEEMRELNPQIRDPSLVAAETELKAYSRTVEPRRLAA